MSGLPFSILIVEDDADDRVIIDEAFIAIGFEAEVKKFKDGQALLQYLHDIDASVYPSLIVLDNTLPQMDASRLLGILKEDPRFAPIPVIIYSTSIPQKKEEELKKLGAYACFEKKILMKDIIEVAQKFREVAVGHKKEERTVQEEKQSEET